MMTMLLILDQFNLQLLGRFDLKIKCNIQAKEGKKVYIFGLGHMTKIIMCTSHREKKKAKNYALLIMEPDVNLNKVVLLGSYF